MDSREHKQASKEDEASTKVRRESVDERLVREFEVVLVDPPPPETEMESTIVSTPDRTAPSTQNSTDPLDCQDQPCTSKEQPPASKINLDNSVNSSDLKPIEEAIAMKRRLDNANSQVHTDTINVEISADERLELESEANIPENITDENFDNYLQEKDIKERKKKRNERGTTPTAVVKPTSKPLFVPIQKCASSSPMEWDTLLDRQPVPNFRIPRRRRSPPPVETRIGPPEYLAEWRRDEQQRRADANRSRKSKSKRREKRGMDFGNADIVSVSPPRPSTSTTTSSKSAQLKSVIVVPSSSNDTRHGKGRRGSLSSGSTAPTRNKKESRFSNIDEKSNVKTLREDQQPVRNSRQTSSATERDHAQQPIERRQSSLAQSEATNNLNSRWDIIPPQTSLDNFDRPTQIAWMRARPDVFPFRGAYFENLQPVPRDISDIDPRACFCCGQLGHPRRDCRTGYHHRYCHNCGRRGVTMQDCPRCHHGFMLHQREQLLRDLPRGQQELAALGSENRRSACNSDIYSTWESRNNARA